jgi:hypothetical protein
MTRSRTGPAALLLALTTAGPAATAPPPERLLPAGTAEFVCLPEPGAALAHWRRTDLARFLNDPQFEAFAGRPADGPAPWPGLTTAELERAAGGPVAWAHVGAARLLLLDTTGKYSERDALLSRFADRTARHGGTARADGEVTVHTWAEGQPPRTQELALGVREGVLVISDSPDEVRAALGRGAGAATLADAEAYRAVARRAGVIDGHPVHVRWFAAPFAPGGVAGDAAWFKEEGFSAIRGMGGVVSFDAAGNDLISRSFTHAPPPYQKSMGMFRFTAAARAAPEPWVPADATAYLTVRADLPAGFDSFGTFFDKVFNQPGAFEEILTGMRNGQRGAGVDFRKEVMGQLTGRISAVRDNGGPARFRDRLLMAFEVRPKADGSDPEAVLARATRRILEPDDRVRRVQGGGTAIWEFDAGVAEVKGSRATVKLPNPAFALARGHLFLSSHTELLEKVLLKGPKLAADADYARVGRELDRLGPAQESARGFARPAELVRATYDLVRTGSPGEPGTFAGMGLREVLKRLGADGRRLPPLDRLGGHPGPAGMVMVNHPDGWEYVVVLLKRPGT